MIRTPWPLASLLLACLALCGGCSDSSSSDDDSFHVRSTSQAVDGTTDVVVVGAWAVFFGDENFLAGGTDLNGDSDTLDDVAVALNMSRGREFMLGVAGDGAAIVEGEIYLDVSEANDGVDWNLDTVMDDRVLLHWSDETDVVAFVDTLSAAAGAVALVGGGERLYYASDTVPAGVDETSLRYIESDDPTTPVVVLNEAGAGNLRPTLLGEDDGLLFLLLDEVVEGIDLNADTDTTDGFVLALLDGSEDASRTKNVGLALLDDAAPFAARPTGDGTPSDWLVAFLVDEAAQGTVTGMGLNDQALFTQMLLPDSCAGTPDTDTSDTVLHYLEFQDFLAALSGPVNTGLAGRDRVVVVDGAVATVSPETEANCDMNEDTDTADVMARWVRTQSPIMPPRDPSQLLALENALPGGSMGLSSLGDRLVAIVDEAQDSRNHDGKSQNHDLAAWLDPANGFNTNWDFSHQSGSTRSHGTGVFDSNDNSEPFAGASWMAAEEQEFRLGLAFQEAVPGTNPLVGSLNTNLACNFMAKDNDVTDSLPTWCDFEPGPTLDFDGVGFAVVPDNAGIVVTQPQVFFRVSEMLDNTDYDGDNTKTDVILMRNPRLTCGPRAMAVCSTISGPVVFTDGRRGAAFYASEFQSSRDLNDDGDMNDTVLRYFTF